MTHATSALAVLLVVAAVPGAAAQPANTSPAQPTAPRMEIGGGFTGAMPFSTDWEGTTLAPMADVRAGVALTRRWSLEGAFDLWPDSNGVTTVYRAQARWRIRGGSAAGDFQTHVTLGGAGAFWRRSYRESRWQDASGAVHVYPAGSYWNAVPPMFPTVGVGVQKTLGAHAALRADLAALIVPYDDGATVLLMPSVSLSLPIGHYPARTR